MPHPVDISIVKPSGPPVEVLRTGESLVKSLTEQHNTVTMGGQGQSMGRN